LHKRNTETSDTVSDPGPAPITNAPTGGKAGVAKPEEFTTDIDLDEEFDETEEEIDADLDEELDPDLDEDELAADLDEDLDDSLSGDLAEGDELVEAEEDEEEDEEDEEEEEETLEDEEDEEEEEEGLDVLLTRETRLDDEIRLDDEARDSLGNSDAPISAGEFTCRSCFLVKRRPQLADEERMICLDCA
jgi:hypothetical protein